MATSPIGPAQNDYAVTQVLLDVCDGDASAAERLWGLVYDELRRVAHFQMRGERSGHTLSTTALVHEAYLRLVDQRQVEWQGRAHFFGVAARAMRQILVDYARRKNALKRGGNLSRMTLDEALHVSEDRSEVLIALDEALNRLATLNPRLSQVVECRYFGGLSKTETAEVLQISVRTVHRDWIKAKGWLYREMYGDGERATNGASPGAPDSAEGTRNA